MAMRARGRAQRTLRCCTKVTRKSTATSPYSASIAMTKTTHFMPHPVRVRVHPAAGEGGGGGEDRSLRMRASLAARKLRKMRGVRLPLRMRRKSATLAKLLQPRLRTRTKLPLTCPFELDKPATCPKCSFESRRQLIYGARCLCVSALKLTLPRAGVICGLCPRELHALCFLRADVF